jgi:hypothetical protein
VCDFKLKAAIYQLLNRRGDDRRFHGEVSRQGPATQPPHVIASLPSVDGMRHHLHSAVAWDSLDPHAI